MNSFTRRVLSPASQALVVGLALLGAVGVLTVLYLSPAVGCVLLVAVVGCGSGCLAVRELVLRHRVRRAAAAGTAQAETWLRGLRGRAEGAE